MAIEDTVFRRQFRPSESLFLAISGSGNLFLASGSPFHVSGSPGPL